MKVFICIALAMLQIQVAIGVKPSYNTLKTQLPIQVGPNKGDQYFFFIVPVQKNDEPNVLLQMAQVQDATDENNSSILATRAYTQNYSIYTSGEENVDLKEVFVTPEDNRTAKFNFQVPVIVPMDFHFTYDPATTTETLPECSVDARTWKERVISRIAEKLELEGEYAWDHTDLTVRIRLHKDALSAISLSDITTEGKLNTYFTALVATKTLADIRYTNLLSNITQITGGHVSIAAEGVDTYQMLMNCVGIGQSAGSYLDNTAYTGTLSTLRRQIDLLSDPITTTLNKFRALLMQVKDLEAK